jgi:hypothetical protein
MTVVLAFLKGYWLELGLGAAIVTLFVLFRITEGQRDTARAERDLARTQYAGALAAFEAEKVSTLAAVTAAQSCAADSADADKRCSTVILAGQKTAAALRAQLGKCQTVGALIERFNAADGDL